VNTFFWLLSGVVSALTVIVLLYLLTVRHHRRTGDEVESIYPLYRDRLEICRDTMGGTLDERLARIMRTGVERRILALSPGNRFSILRVGWPVRTAVVTLILSFAALAIFLLVGDPNPH
jgi:cytochrome c-type biogenesis protein CcmI